LRDAQPVETPNKLSLEVRIRLYGDVSCPAYGRPGWSARFVVSHGCLRLIGSVIARLPLGEVKSMVVARMSKKKEATSPSASALGR
jgi:hypothetical protein